MTIFAFLGPSLSVDDAKRELDAVYLPPARVGDVYRIACSRPRAIVLIDGIFERAASVWHKEILWAMSEGVHVFGGASMGALRAAELAEFGMEGVGAVYTAYREGALEDDDEVAVACAGAEAGHRPFSEAMVNVRATLEAAAGQAVVSRATQLALVRLAKGQFYTDRIYERVLRAGEQASLPTAELAALRAWLPHGRVDVKRDDALRVLGTVRERLASGLGPKTVAYRFEHTQAWEVLQRRFRTAGGEIGVTVDDTDELVFDELRLRGRFVATRRAAMGRVLALAEARDSGKPFSSKSSAETEERLRRERGLERGDDFRAWLLENGFTPHRLDQFLADEARVQWIDETLGDSSRAYIIDELRLTGLYVPLLGRAREKHRVLIERGHDPRTHGVPKDLDDSALWRWFFVDWIGAERVPDDLAGHARRIGFQDFDSFRGAVLREYLSR